LPGLQQLFINKHNKQLRYIIKHDVGHKKRSFGKVRKGKSGASLLGLYREKGFFCRVTQQNVP
jgi:hypothetical protein